MRFGSFDDTHREYVIDRPDTPLPWINYLGCEDYFGLISNTAGGYSFYKDARLRRLTRFRYNNVPTDSGGRYIYLRDDETGAFWSPTWQPVRQELDTYQCRHGLGYTIITSEKEQIEAQIRYFVPLSQTLEVWELKITNHRPKPTQLSIFSLIEFCLWDALDDASNFQRNFNTGQVEVEDCVIYHKTEYRERRDHFAYFACSEPLAGFETQREAFLGPYQGFDLPQAVERGTCSRTVAQGWSPIGCHHIKLIMQAGETHQINFILGYHENPKDHKFEPAGSQTIYKATVKPVINRFLDTKNIGLAFKELATYWDGLVNTLQVQSPDDHTNRMVNIWNAYQCMVTFNISRSASYFESGISRGLGFRDSNQDLLGFVHMIPDRARQRILDLAATQMETGGAYHQYQPLTKRGNNAVGSNFNDDPLWLVLGVATYLKETGDWSILDELVPYDNLSGSEKPLYEHLQRSIRYTLDRLGLHGLPLIGRADWNDCLNLNAFSSEPGESFQTTTNKDGKVAESVFIAGLFVLAASEMAEIAQRYGMPAEARNYHAEAKKMELVVLEHGWDGDWFLRAYDDYGHKVGSKECAEGAIYVEPQGICIMAGIGMKNGFAERALKAVNSHLATEHGIVLQQPPYSQYYIHLGEISSYPPGYKENAGIFCHTNPWIMIAEACVGHGNQAHDYYLRINPSAREEISDLHRCEPYIYAQMIAGRDAPTHGEAKNSWLTGTAAWNYVAITQWILGIRPTYEGLQVAPVIPTSWQGFKVQRKFRGNMVYITVKRAGAGNKVSLKVNGIPVEGNIVSIPQGKTMDIMVDVTLS